MEYWAALNRYPSHRLQKRMAHSRVLCGLVALASAGVRRETLYRITPRNYTGLIDLDTGDAAGDAFFGLYEKSAPVVCANASKDSRPNILCENDALLQIPGFNVYAAFDVEFDDRRGAAPNNTFASGRH